MKMIENTRHIITIGGNRTIKEVVRGSGYRTFGPLILERCVLTPGPERKATIEIFQSTLDHDLTDAEIEAEYVRHNLKFPTVDHAIHFGNQKRDLPEKGHPIVFYLNDPFSHVLFLLRRGAHRELYWFTLYPGGRWKSYERFAGVRE